MIEVKKFNSFSDFYIYNLSFIEANRMLNVLLRRTINDVIQGNINPYQYFTIEDGDTQIVVLRIPQICLIYSNQDKEELIPVLSQELKFQEFLRFTFAGNKQIIESLLKYHKSEYTIQKHLIIYKCEKVSEDYKYAPGEMQIANVDDLDTLIKFNMSFNKEYNGEQESYVEAKAFIISSLKDETLFIWKNKNHLCSIAQVIFREGNDYPEIGQVFTEPKLRKRGFAPSLVHKLTNYLLNNGNQKCMLYTNGTNKASNRAFIKIGYLSTGDYIMCYKEK
jgi:predicted GNAT family acetyltransferase